MRYLPLTDADRAAMLGVIGATSIDALFADVPRELYLAGPIDGLPTHASEMAVERHMPRSRRRTFPPARRRSSSGPGPIATTSRRASTT